MKNHIIWSVKHLYFKIIVWIFCWKSFFNRNYIQKERICIQKRYLYPFRRLGRMRERTHSISYCPAHSRAHSQHQSKCLHFKLCWMKLLTFVFMSIYRSVFILTHIRVRNHIVWDRFPFKKKQLKRKKNNQEIT